MSTILINGRPFTAGLYWLERAGPAATARAARRFARPWCVHRSDQTGYAGGAGGDAPEGLPALAPALVDSIESEFWMALVAGDAATGNSATEWLLAENVLAGPKRRDSVLDVVLHPGQDSDGIDLRVA